MAFVCSTSCFANKNDTVDGWLKVSIDERAILAADNEFLAALIEQGLDINTSTWIKPTFGSDNMLWFVDTRGVGRNYYQRLADMDSQQFPNTQKQTGDGTPWQYTGYRYNDTTFVLRVYLCTQRDNNTVLLFWSGESAPKYHDLEKQLELLKGNCKK